VGNQCALAGAFVAPERSSRRRLSTGGAFYQRPPLRNGQPRRRRSRGILALPMHDGLLVPVTGAGYVGGALDSAYSYFAKVRIRWKLTPAPGVARA
jgi:hypothetical protein